MIPRYTRPEMARVWSDENKLDSWLKVEIAVCEAWAERGAIPPDAVEKIRRARRPREGAQEHGLPGPQPRRPRRAHLPRPQARRLVRRDAPQHPPPYAGKGADRRRQDLRPRRLPRHRPA